MLRCLLSSALYRLGVEFNRTGYGRTCQFCCLKEASTSVHVLLNGILRTYGAGFDDSEKASPVWLGVLVRDSRDGSQGSSCTRHARKTFAPS